MGAAGLPGLGGGPGRDESPLAAGEGADVMDAGEFVAGERAHNGDRSLFDEAAGLNAVLRG